MKRYSHKNTIKITALENCVQNQNSIRGCGQNQFDHLFEESTNPQNEEEKCVWLFTQMATEQTLCKYPEQNAALLPQFPTQSCTCFHCRRRSFSQCHRRSGHRRTDLVLLFPLKRALVWQISDNDNQQYNEMASSGCKNHPVQRHSLLFLLLLLLRLFLFLLQ